MAKEAMMEISLATNITRAPFYHIENSNRGNQGFGQGHIVYDHRRNSFP